MWKPAWVEENRTPAFMGGGIGQHFGAQKYLWGNVPAFDILRLESNEGEGYSKDLHLLFAGNYYFIRTLISHEPQGLMNTFLPDSFWRPKKRYQDGHRTSKYLQSSPRHYDK